LPAEKKNLKKKRFFIFCSQSTMFYEAVTYLFCKKYTIRILNMFMTVSSSHSKRMNEKKNFELWKANTNISRREVDKMKIYVKDEKI
jgi:hypothetical protein